MSRPLFGHERLEVELGGNNENRLNGSRHQVYEILSPRKDSTPPEPVRLRVPIQFAVPAKFDVIHVDPLSIIREGSYST